MNYKNLAITSVIFTIATSLAACESVNVQVEVGVQKETPARSNPFYIILEKISKLGGCDNFVHVSDKSRIEVFGYDHVFRYGIIYFRRDIADLIYKALTLENSSPIFSTKDFAVVASIRQIYSSRNGGRFSVRESDLEEVTQERASDCVEAIKIIEKLAKQWDSTHNAEAAQPVRESK